MLSLPVYNLKQDPKTALVDFKDRYQNLQTASWEFAQAALSLHWHFKNSNAMVNIPLENDSTARIQTFSMFCQEAEVELNVAEKGVKGLLAKILLLQVLDASSPLLEAPFTSLVPFIGI